MSLEPSAITVPQWRKVAKALAYSFSAGFLGTLVLFAADFIKAAQGGQAAIENLAFALVVASVIGGINAALVTVKQLFTPPAYEPPQVPQTPPSADDVSSQRP